MKYGTSLILFLALGSNVWAQNQAQTRTQDPLKNVKKTSGFSTQVHYFTRSFTSTKTLSINSTSMNPSQLNVSMLRLGGRYDFTDTYSIGLSAVHLKNEIELVGFNHKINAETSGMSDTVIDITRNDNFGENTTFHFGFGLSLPTGSIDQQQKGRLISYSGQLGSGTYDFVPYISGKTKLGSWEFSERLWGKIRTGRNHRDYRLGDEFRATAKAKYNVNKYFALVGDVHYKHWHDVHGSQYADMFSKMGPPPSASHLAPSQSETEDPHYQDRPYHKKSGSPPTHDYQMVSSSTDRVRTHSVGSSSSIDPFEAGGSRWGANLGLATGLYLGYGIVASLEAGVPVYYKQASQLDGLEVSWYATSFIQASF